MNTDRSAGEETHDWRVCIAGMYESEDEDLYDPPHVKRKSFLLLILLVLAAATLVVTGLALLAYMYWRRKQHEAHQARFMELFEDDESFQADLGLKEDL